MSLRKMSNQQGFTLIEVIVVVAILGIIAAIALPSFTDSTQKGRRSDGQAALMDAASKMETYFFTNKEYTDDLTDLGYSAASAVATPEGHYTISVTAPTTACPIASCFSIQATAVGGQVDDGNLTLNSLGQKLPADKW